MNQRSLKTLFDAGVKIAFGTDSGATAMRIPGWAAHRELRLIVASGLTPSQALTIATRNAADLLTRDDRGILAAGKRADLVILNGDPTADANIDSVWRGDVQSDGPIGGFSENKAP